MKQYLELLKDVLKNGQRESNRTGIDTLSIQGAMLKFDLRDGFPAVTTKKLAWKAVVGELIGFLRGSTSLAEFKELGCNVWDANASAPAWQDNPACRGADDLGRIYGAQWRDWTSKSYINREAGSMLTGHVDQIKVALDLLRHNPESRRILVNAWNPAELDQAALPPCHVLFQLLPRSDDTLHMTMYQRSADLFLGVPFNIASYAILLELFAAWSGRRAATLTMFLADVHIYENHIEQVKDQLSREPLPLTSICFDPVIGMLANNPNVDCLIDTLWPEKIKLVDYKHHPAISAPMAV